MICSIIIVVYIVWRTLSITAPSEDFLYIISRIKFESLATSFYNIIMGLLSFIFFLVVPGLPFFMKCIDGNIKNLEISLIFCIVYASVGMYFWILFLMIINASVLTPFGPFLLLSLALHLPSIGTKPKKRSENDEVQTQGIFGVKIKPQIGAFLFVFLLIVLFRVLLYSIYVVEFSDGLIYDFHINAIANNSYLRDPEFARRAPLYSIIAYQFSWFLPTAIDALKCVSFVFSLAIIFPAISIMKTLSGKEKIDTGTYILLVLILFTYSWINLLSVVNLQDVLLSFYTISFIAIMLTKEAFSEILGGACGALAFLSRYSLGVLAPIGFLFILVHKENHRIRIGLRFIITWSLIAISWILRNLLVAGVLLSITDEARLSLNHLYNGLTNSIAHLLMNDIYGVNMLIVWIPAAIMLVLSFFRRQGRKHLAPFYSREYAFIFLVMVSQIFVISLFESYQSRFLLSVIWIIPIFWIHLNTKLNVQGIGILALGWIVFNMLHCINIFRVYWLFTEGVLPPGDWTWDYQISEAMMPTELNVVMGLISLISLLVVSTLLSKIGKEVGVNPYSDDCVK
ncbi:MAG: hypothetical protein ACFFED_14720 [Candidatus Thorarchaeota archaeon]